MSLLLIINWNVINKINWDFISTLIQGINLILVFLPAIFLYIYNKAKKIKIIVSKSSAGSLVIIQNISKNTIFIKSVKLIVNHNIIDITKNDSNKEIEANKALHKKIDYKILNIKNVNSFTVKVDIFGIIKYSKKVKL